MQPDRFTIKSQEAIQAAQALADQRRNPQTTPEHLLAVLLEQDGAKLLGTHQGEFASGDLSGSVAANTLRFQSALGTEGTRVSFQFTGTAEGDKMSGTVALGEYGEARWTAQKHQYRTGGRRG